MADNKKITDTIQMTFNSIKDKIQQKDHLDDIGDVINRISSSIINKDSANYVEMIRRVFSQAMTEEKVGNMASGLIYSYDIIERLTRYANAEEICDNIPYCARALKVLADEIMSSDDITKETLNIYIDNASQTGPNENAPAQVRSINEVLKVEEMAYDIVYDTLKFGDYFIEMCDFTSKDVPIIQSLLSEAKTINESATLETEQLLQEGPYTVTYKDINESNEQYDKEIKVNVELVDSISQEINDETLLTEDVIDINAKNNQYGTLLDDKEVKIDNVKLLPHDPRFVIKLQSHKFRLCLGYLVLPRPSGSNRISPLTSMGMGGSRSTGNMGSSASSLLSMGAWGQNDFMGIDRIYLDLLNTVKKYIGKGKVEELDIDKKEVLHMVIRAIKDFEDQDNNVNIQLRYVPPERMQHFMVGTRRFFPYGESIFYKITFAAKLLIAFETALVMKRISDSSDKRVIYVETGLPRNLRNLIEEIKEALRKRKFSLDTMGSVGAIPSMMTSYEDYYLPQNKGKKYIEFDNLPNNLNIRDISDELKLLRDMLVAALDVPPSFIGVEENLSNKAALSFESIQFARTIISYQKGLSRYVKDWFGKMYKFIYKKPMPSGININFPPPKALQSERDAETLETVARIINVLKELGVPLEYLKQKYISLDWEEIKKFEIAQRLKTELDKADVSLTPDQNGNMGY